MAVNPIIIDASIAVKWYIEEEDSHFALALRDKFINGDIELVVPSLFYYEVLNALKYSNLFDLKELNEVGTSLENYGLSSISIRDDVREKMVEIVMKYDLSIYDAAYIAIALNVKGTLFTADDKIIKKLPKKFLTYVKTLSQLHEVFQE